MSKRSYTVIIEDDGSYGDICFPTAEELKDMIVSGGYEGAGPYVPSDIIKIEDVVDYGNIHDIKVGDLLSFESYFWRVDDILYDGNYVITTYLSRNKDCKDGLSQSNKIEDINKLINENKVKILR